MWPVAFGILYASATVTLLWHYAVAMAPTRSITINTGLLENGITVDGEDRHAGRNR